MSYQLGKMLLPSETLGYYIITHIPDHISVPHHLYEYAGGSTFLQAYRLSYYQPTWLGDQTSIIFYVGLRERMPIYTTDTLVWFDTLPEMVASLQKWTQGPTITAQPIELHPLPTRRLSLKMLSGDMVTVDIDYTNVLRSPFQQVRDSLQRPTQFVLFDDDGVVRDVEHDWIEQDSQLNIYIHYTFGDLKRRF